MYSSVQKSQIMDTDRFLGLVTVGNINQITEQHGLVAIAVHGLTD